MEAVDISELVVVNRYIFLSIMSYYIKKAGGKMTHRTLQGRILPLLFVKESGRRQPLRRLMCQ